MIAVTVQLILYIPILVCAFILTFMHLNETPYIAAAAFFLQYPYKLIIAHLLCRDYEPKSKKQSATTAAEITLVSNNMS
uniref:G protein-coupled receptor n=1 Tax=Panagrolaimus sp. ES5 TaxID=591445 RepID=A0AC34FA57_9BILA